MALGLEPGDVAAALAAVSPVHGRLQVVATPEAPAAGGGTAPPFTVMVDYAHTPAGLEVVLGEARSLDRSGPAASSPSSAAAATATGPSGR